jgi:Dna[CI] antecedent, DciA
MRKPPREPLFAPEPLDSILARAGESRFSRVRPPVPAHLWREAVGARIAEHARPVWLQGGTLVLRVASSVWAHELSFLAEELCARLRQCGIEARSLRFRVGSLPAPERPAELRVARRVPTAAPIPPEVARALGDVGDEPLRAAIARAASANLAWQSSVQVAPAEEVSEAMRAARAPRAAEGETSPPGRASPVARAGAPYRPAAGRDRSR